MRVEELVLALSVFPDAVDLQQPDELGRLKTTTVNGDADGDGLNEEIYAYGARSFSIWDAEGNIVGDSGSEIAEIVLDEAYSNFNSAAIRTAQKLPMADAMILAIARAHDATLWTQDIDFAEMEGVQFVPKQQTNTDGNSPDGLEANGASADLSE